MRLKTNVPTLFYFILMGFLISGVYCIKDKYLYPKDSNMGARTDYFMSLTPENKDQLTNLNIKLTFPSGYNLPQMV